MPCSLPCPASLDERISPGPSTSPVPCFCMCFGRSHPSQAHVGARCRKGPARCEGRLCLAPASSGQRPEEALFLRAGGAETGASQPAVETALPLPCQAAASGRAGQAPAEGPAFPALPVHLCLGQQPGRCSLAARINQPARGRARPVPARAPKQLPCLGRHSQARAPTAGCSAAAEPGSCPRPQSFLRARVLPAGLRPAPPGPAHARWAAALLGGRTHAVGHAPRGCPASNAPVPASAAAPRNPPAAGPCTQPGPLPPPASARQLAGALLARLGPSSRLCPDSDLPGAGANVRPPANARTAHLVAPLSAPSPRHL